MPQLKLSPALIMQRAWRIVPVHQSMRFWTELIIWTRPPNPDRCVLVLAESPENGLFYVIEKRPDETVTRAWQIV